MTNNNSYNLDDEDKTIWHPKRSQELFIKAYGTTPEQQQVSQNLLNELLMMSDIDIEAIAKKSKD